MNILIKFLNYLNDNIKFFIVVIFSIIVFLFTLNFDTVDLSLLKENKIINDKILPLTFAISTLIIATFITLKMFLNYLDNKTATKSDYERINKIERDFKKLLSLKINTTAKITDEEKKDLLEKLIVQFENGITEDFRKKIEDKFQISSLQQYSRGAIHRLREEIDSLNRRGNINLFIGMFLSLSGLAYLGFTVYTSNAYTTYEMLFIHLAPRTLFVIFIELFSFFFLNLYKKSLDDIKYYQNEITNLEAKYLSLDQSKQSGNFKLLTNALETLNKTERNFILKKDETTIELEKNKIEVQSSNNTVQALKDIINFKR